MLICSDSNRIWQMYAYINKFTNTYIRYIYIRCMYVNTQTHTSEHVIIYYA